MITKSKKVDPILLAVLDSRFNQITEEIGRVLIRTSRSPVFAEARDFGVAIFDKDLRLIAQKEYIPVLAGAISVSLENMVAAYKDDINEGDVFIHNNCYTGNTHLGDMDIAKPVFYQGELMFWCAVKGHMADIGGKGIAGGDPTATNIGEEGLIIPVSKLYEKGRINRGVRDIILANNKLPEIVWGDITCEIGGVTVGERSFQELVKRYGAETVYECIDEILTASEREMRNKIRQIPDGVYYGEKSTDHDSILRDKPVTARVKVIKQDDELTIDLSESDPQVPGHLNSSWGCTVSICHLIVSYAIPGEVRRNHGAMRPIKIKTHKGTWVDAKYPAAVGKDTTTGAECIGEALLLAFSKAIPFWAAAPHGKMVQYTARGFNPRTKRRWLDIDFFMRCCPSGGTEGYDGWDLGGPLFELGEGRFPDLEIIELIKPVHILQYEQEQDTEGSGKFRSGLGHVYKVQYLSDVDNGHLFGAGMRDFSTPSGLFGGNCPRPTTVVVHRTDGRMEKLDVHIFLKLLAGDIMEEHSMGGGGFGKPFERDVERVRQDVKNGVVSIEKAEKDYGVVINPFTLKINIEATEELRKGR